MISYQLRPFSCICDHQALIHLVDRCPRVPGFWPGRTFNQKTDRFQNRNAWHCVEALLARHAWKHVFLLEGVRKKYFWPESENCSKWLQNINTKSNGIGLPIFVVVVPNCVNFLKVMLWGWGDSTERRIDRQTERRDTQTEDRQTNLADFLKPDGQTDRQTNRADFLKQPFASHDENRLLGESARRQWPKKTFQTPTTVWTARPLH